jgi:hypothetical protein
MLMKVACALASALIISFGFPSWIPAAQAGPFSVSIRAGRCSVITSSKCLELIAYPSPIGRLSLKRATSRPRLNGPAPISCRASTLYLQITINAVLTRNQSKYQR